MLSADDNDGNVFNGTPHDSQICDAFVNDHWIIGSYLAGEIKDNITISNNIDLIDNVIIGIGKTLTFDSGVTVDLNNCYIKINGTIVNNGTITPANYVLIKQGAEIKGYYPTLASAVSAAVSGQTIYVSGTQTLSGDISVPSGVTLTINSTATVTLNSHSIISTGGTISLDAGAEISPNKVLLNRYSSGPEGIFPTIQQAVNYASSGDEIELFAETYTGDFGVSGKTYITIAGKASGATPTTVINGDVSIYNSDYCTLAYLHVNDVLEVSLSDHAELFMLDVDDRLAFSNSDYAELWDVENNSGNNSIGFSLFGSSIGGEENIIFQTSTCGLQCNGWSDAVLYGQLFCGNSSYDIRLEGPPLSTNSVALYQGDVNNTPSFSASTVGSRIYDPHNDVYWSSWNYCGVLSKVSHAEQTDAEYDPVNEVIFEDPAKEEYRKTLEDYFSFLREIRSSKEKNTDEDLNNKLVEFSNRFDEIVNTFPGSPVAVKSLFHKAKILRQTGNKEAGEEYIESKQNENSQFSNYLSSHRLMFDIKDGNYAEALENIEAILKKLTDPSEIAQLLYDKAMLYRFGLQDETKALETFNEIVEKYPDTQIAQSALRQLKKKYQDNEEIAQNNVGDEILASNYPNPFNPSTTISFALPEEAEVEIIIYDLLGRKVWEQARMSYAAGNHTVTWQGVNKAGQKVSTGTYIVRLKSEKFQATQKILLMK